jgi:hypothetical protein
MNLDQREIWNSMQRLASFVFLKKTPMTVRFVTEWLAYAQDPRVISDVNSTFRKDYPEFVDHRHDQSILSLMSKKYSLSGLPDPSQWGEPWKNGTYGYMQVIQHTRCRK